MITYERFLKEGKRPCVINYYHDTRYDPELLSTHDKVKIKCEY